MTENQVLEAIREYAKGMELSDPENGIIEMKLPDYKGARRHFIKYEVNKAGSSWVTFRVLLGQILEPKACIDLLFMRKWGDQTITFMHRKWGTFVTCLQRPLLFA